VPNVAIDAKLPYATVGTSKQPGKAEVKLNSALDRARRRQRRSAARP
jgi:hypothetical protein